jgi:hypothetical protein
MILTVLGLLALSLGALSMIGATVLALLNLRLDLTPRLGVAGAALTLASLAALHFAGGW